MDDWYWANLAAPGGLLGISAPPSQAERLPSQADYGLGEMEAHHLGWFLEHWDQPCFRVLSVGWVMKNNMSIE